MKKQCQRHSTPKAFTAFTVNNFQREASTSYEILVKLKLFSYRATLYPGVNKKPQKFIFEYWVFSQKSYLNVGCFEEIHICIPKIRYLHTS